MTAWNRPNIVLVVTDQMTVRSMPFHGNQVVRAPTMAKLADEGVVFDAMYCNYPLCAPSRVGMLTGKLPSQLEAYDNGAEFPASHITVAHALRNAGYLTCLSGKMHFIGPDQLHGFEERLTTDIYPSDFGWTADWSRKSGGTGEMRVVAEAGRCKRSVQLDFDDEVAFRARRWIYKHVRARKGDPFLLTVSFTHPHDPFSISDEYWDRYRHADIDMPSLPRALDPHSRRLRHHFGIDAEEVGHDQVRNARHAYYGSLSYLDDRLQELLKTLDECGIAQNTIVVLTSDHGEFLGERDLWFKRSFFEEAIRVPFVVHAPAMLRPRRVEVPCSLADLLPTFAEIAGGSSGGASVIEEELAGESVAGLLTGRGAAHAPVFAELMAEGTPAPLFMVRKGQYKYVHCELDPPQLFDLSQDPLERRSLLDQPGASEEARNAQLVAELHQLVQARWDLKALPQKVVNSQQRRKTIAAALSRGKTFDWDYDAFEPGRESYYRNSLAFDAVRLLDAAISSGTILRKGSALTCGNYSLGETREQAIAALERDLDLANAVNRSVQEATTFMR
jgi:choline-sulfatase